jgi:hypothetical protein
LCSRYAHAAAHAKWQHVAGILLSAARTERDDLIAIAIAQLMRALETPPFAPIRLAGHTPPKKPAAPRARRHSLYEKLLLRLI